MAAIGYHHAGARAREWLVRLGLVFASVLLALLVAEVLLRTFIPISDRRDNVTLDGRVIPGFLEPGLVYRQVSNEYDVVTTITDKGHRVPEVARNPDVIFIGDSFTFGWGLEDEDTFASVYCVEQRISCANLGYPGSGTLRQVERLETFLEQWNWRPREVKLFFFGMSGSFSAGNDFVDNYDRARRLADTRDETLDAAEPRRGLIERAIALQPVLLRHSHLIRVLKFYAGPVLRAMFIAEPGDARMVVALEATRAALTRLDALSASYGFDYTIYLLVPVQDILRNTHGDTLATLNSVSPKPAVSTASLFAESPADFYFPFDGHINREGARRIAEFLVAQDSEHSG